MTAVMPPPAMSRRHRYTEPRDLAARWTPMHYGAVALIGVLLAALRCEGSLETDVLWSARFGLNFLSTGHLYRYDHFSWSADGKQWFPNSWAWNVILGAAYRVGGTAGIWALGFAVAALLGVVVGAFASRYGARPWPTIATLAALGPFLVVALPRAQALSNAFPLLFAIVVPRFVGGNIRQAVKTGALLCAVQVFWMNLHSLALLGPVFVLAAGLAEAWAHGTMPVLPKLGRVAVLTAACAASCLANPYGTAPIAHASEVRAASAGIISEWAPAGFGSLGQRFALAIVVTGVLLGALAFRRHRLASGSILLVLAALSATAVRFAPMAATLIVPELALLVTRLRVRRRIWKVGAALVCVVFVLGVVRHVSSFARLTERDASPGLVARLPRDCRLVNDYSLGGAVILLRPDVKVSVDGRNDLYGKQLVLSMLSLVGNAPGTANRLHAEHVTCVLTFSNSPLVSALAKNPQWRVIGHDSIRTLLVRETQ